MPITIWARDRYIARQRLDLSGQAPSFVPVEDESYEPDKANDLCVQDLLGAAGLAPQVLDTWVHLEGGNVVSNCRHVFVGINAVEENGGGGVASELAREIERLFGRRHLFLTDDADDAPWSHADMYLAPVSESTVLVANPRFGRRLLAPTGRFEEAVPESGDGQSGEWLGDWHEAGFDHVAALLREQGYEVWRLPALCDPEEDWMITYTNVIMERRGGRRIVYMPVYRLPVLDRMAGAIYRAMGFEVRTVDVSGIYVHGGALRCVANVTERRADSGSANAPRRRRGHVRFTDLSEGAEAECAVHRLARQKRL
jgi:N-dimethylarginine dimethylaminohydrolase